MNAEDMPEWVEKVALAICKEWDLKYRDGSGYVYIEEVEKIIWEEYKNAQQSVHSNVADLPCCCAEIFTAGVINPDCPRHGAMLARR